MATVTDQALPVRTVTAELLTEAAFAPFGHVLSDEHVPRLPVDLYGDRVNVHRPAPIEADEPIEWLFVRLHVRELRVVFLERHLRLAQAFVPLDARPFVLAVAPPDAPEEAGLPTVDSVRAFVVPGDRGVQLHRGTWHEPPFPLVDATPMLMTSHQALTRGIGAPLDECGEIAQLDVDKRNVAERGGYLLRLALR